MVTWVLLAGLPATGKSTLSALLRQHLETRQQSAVIIDKDRVRSTLFPDPVTDYTAEQDAICFRAMLEAAAYLTAHESARYILFDGRTFSRAALIDATLKAAQNAGAETRILQLICPESVSIERLAQPDPKHPARNRDLALYQRIKSSFEPITHPHFTLNTCDDLEAAAKSALDYILQPQNCCPEESASLPPGGSCL